MKGVHTFVCKLSSISSGPATDRVSVLCQCAAEPDRQSQTGRARQGETGTAKQAEPDSQRETTAVERLRARERKAERERERSGEAATYTVSG